MMQRKLYFASIMYLGLSYTLIGDVRYTMPNNKADVLVSFYFKFYTKLSGKKLFGTCMI